LTPDRASLLDRLASAPERLGLAAERTRAAHAAAGGPPAGEWSAREVVAHLVSVETTVWQARLDSLAADGTPSWTWTEPGPATGPETATLERASGRFAELRAATIARVAILDEAGWARAGIHATFGRLDVEGLLRVIVDHDEEHIAGLTHEIG
jgi:hypothetical protein